MIRFDQVTFSYPSAKSPALRDFSLTIKPGESVCVLGANGSGKSTLARLIAGLEKVSLGRLKVNGTAPGAASIGFLFQNVDNQIVAATVNKEIAFGLENHGVASAQMHQRVGETLTQFEITELARRLTSELSGGEKQRVALASVMVLSPGILILDEPDSFLDVPGRRILDRQLTKVREQFPNLVEIRITQYPDVARSYPRTIVLGQGALEADGKPEEILGNAELLSRTSLYFQSSFSEDNPALALGDTRFNESMPRTVAFDSVCFGYGRHAILHDLNFDISSGESVGMVGPSGSGKSTALKLLCGLLKPDLGAVRFEGNTDGTLDDNSQGHAISAVLQQPERQFFLATCRDEIAFGPSNMGEKIPEIRIRALLRLVGLSESMVSRDPFSLSGGEQRRLAFATVLAMRPRFVAFDEPVSGLDREGVARFIALSRALKGAGVGQLIISHDAEVIRDLTDKVILMRTGQPAEIHTTAAFFAADIAGEFVVF